MTWYTQDTTYDTVLALAFGFVVFVAISSRFVIAPYGRFASKKFGINLSPRLGWFLMELPATVSFVLIYFLGHNRFEVVPLVFLAMWLIHYGNRGFVFPYLMRSPRGATSSFSLSVVLTGWFVTTAHGYLNAAYLSELGTQYTTAWLTDPRFIVGFLIYYSAFSLNIHCDAITRNLRSKEEVESGEKVYRIPRGGLFRYVSNPSYLTELVAWAGFAICTWSLGAVFVLAISCANLIPRAFATHKWYRQQFEDYPAERKVLIPFVL